MGISTRRLRDRVEEEKKREEKMEDMVADFQGITNNAAPLKLILLFVASFHSYGSFNCFDFDQLSNITDCAAADTFGLAGVSAKLVHIDACNYNIIPESKRLQKSIFLIIKLE